MKKLLSSFLLIVLLFAAVVSAKYLIRNTVKLGDSSYDVKAKMGEPYRKYVGLNLYRATDGVTLIITNNGYVQKTVDFTSDRQSENLQGFTPLKTSEIAADYAHYLGMSLEEVETELGPYHVITNDAPFWPGYITEDGHLLRFLVAYEKIYEAQCLDLLDLDETFPLVACAKKFDDSQYPIYLLPQDSILYTKHSELRDYHDVVESAGSYPYLAFFCSVQELQYYKHTSWMEYTTIQTGQGLLFVTDFYASERQDGTPPLDAFLIRFSDAADERALQEIHVGMSLDEVKQADPNGQYNPRTLVLPDETGAKKISQHFFSNGQAYWITYENNRIVSIRNFTI